MLPSKQNTNIQSVCKNHGCAKKCISSSYTQRERIVNRRKIRIYFLWHIIFVCNKKTPIGQSICNWHNDFACSIKWLSTLYIFSLILAYFMRKTFIEQVVGKHYNVGEEN